MPIRLPGAVSEDTKGVTSTELLVLVSLKMPHCMPNDRTTSLQVACGTNVLVNFILGLPFLRVVGATMCFKTDVLTCRNIAKPNTFTM